MVRPLLRRQPSSAAIDDSSETATTPASAANALAVDPAARHEARNFIVLAGHFIATRIAWIFKTESVVMPGFLDLITGEKAGWLRGCLPAINRIGQTILPMYVADNVRDAPKQKWYFVVASLLMGVPFLVLAAVWWKVTPTAPAWLPGVFLLCYVVFNSVTGISALCYGTLQGKLIRMERRGRLLSVAGALGAVGSVSAALLLLSKFQKLPGGGYEFTFAVTGIGFMIAGLIALALAEPARPKDGAHRQRGQVLHWTWDILRTDATFRRFAIMAMLYGSSHTLFPHYQALGRERLGREVVDLMWWVVVQNAGTGLFSAICGWIGDRTGYRAVLRVQSCLVAVTPLVALTLAHLPPEIGQRWYWVTFLLLGMSPVSFRVLTNYTLELVDVSHHARYLSTLNFCLAVPFLLSPAVGGLLHHLDFEPVFIGVSAVVLLSSLLTFWMAEPRAGRGGT